MTRSFSPISGKPNQECLRTRGMRPWHVLFPSPTALPIGVMAHHPVWVPLPCESLTGERSGAESGGRGPKALPLRIRWRLLPHGVALNNQGRGDWDAHKGISRTRSNWPSTCWDLTGHCASDLRKRKEKILKVVVQYMRFSGKSYSSVNTGSLRLSDNPLI